MKGEKIEYYVSVDDSLSKVIHDINQKEDKNITDLFDFLAHESVSTNPAKKNNVQDCATYLEEFIKKIGATHVEQIKTKGHPIVYAEFLSSPDKPTLLIYGHYDVQPEDPISLWISPPFKPEIRDGFIYARGVSDDKGQVFCHLKAIESWIRIYGSCPVNIKCLIEGEEEIGSEHIADVLKENKEKFKADVAIVSDSPMYADKQPALSCSLRGLLYTELDVFGPNADLHSGQLGGIVQNPIQALSIIISKLKNEDDYVLIPGFYDDVEPLSDSLATQLTHIKENDIELANQLGVDTLFGLKGKSTPERKWFQPTLDCNGIVGGFIEEGSKTIIPSKARAKISMRLVSKQNPEKIFEQLNAYIQLIKPEGVQAKLTKLNVANPCSINIESKAFKLAQEAFKQSYHVEPKIVGEGGSIPVIADFKDCLGLDTVMMGFNLPDDGIHSPNERFGVTNYKKGIETAAIYYKLAENIL